MDEKGQIYDPYNGQEDLKKGILRHVSEAFSEDPLRILRVARFKARFGFEIAPETMELMRGIHDAGETQHLTKERIWKEASRALTHDNGSEFFVTLQKIGVGIEIFKEMPGFNTDRNIDFSLTRAPLSSVDEMLKGKSLESRVAHWTLPFERTVDIKASIEMWREAGAPGEIMDRVGMTGAIWNTLAKSSESERTTPSDNWFKMLMELDALRRTDRWIAAYEDVKDHFSIISNKPDFIPDVSTVKEWIDTLKIDAEAVAKSAPNKKDIKDYVFNARKAAWDGLSVKEAEVELEKENAPRRAPRIR
jgi:tRNA nucleotidyltransferase/poly(A) polymerase